MDAIITGESKRIGLSVIDNNEVEHLIEMDEAGEIKYHEQDGYPDKSVERSLGEDERVAQARRYAKYYVSRQRGYDTLLKEFDMDEVVAALLTLQQCSDREFEQLFGTYFRQLQAHFRGDSDPPVEMPDGVSTGDLVCYLQVIYLDSVEDVAIGLAEDIADLDVDLLSEVTDIDSTGHLSASFRRAAQDADIALDSFDIDRTSPIDVVYNIRENATNSGPQPLFGHEYDARIELLPVPAGTIDQLRSIFGWHLLCQVRDCYVLRGIQPPEAYRVLGPGMFGPYIFYKNLDFYEPYHSTTAALDGYRKPADVLDVDTDDLGFL